RSFTSLESLLLYGYHIHKLPEWLGELTSLWRLNLCLGNLQELHKNMRQLTQLQSLSLEKCNKLTSLPQWLGELTLLKTLKLYGCNGIISLPESAITNLQELRISVCHVLFEWCKLEKNKMKLAHIKEKTAARRDVRRI
uniref:NB-ARC domain-containing protein n=1 Tax=Aegilops tauschii subsp. strangulata TaxID=200361 RepID=A0A452ZZ53_AEGTS